MRFKIKIHTHAYRHPSTHQPHYIEKITTARACSPILHIHKALRVRVAKVARVRGAEVDLGLRERVDVVLRVAVGEDARGEARDDLLDVVGVCGVQDVVVDEDVVAQEGELGEEGER